MIATSAQGGSYHAQCHKLSGKDYESISEMDEKVK